MTQAKRTSISDAVSLVGTKFWDAVMGGGKMPSTTLAPAVSDPAPTVVLGGESHIHVDSRERCEDDCFDCEHDLDGCIE
jgi:hypothetical protein